MNNNHTKLGNPLWITWLLWGVSLVFLPAFYIMRYYFQKKYIALADNKALDNEYIEHNGDYFYQTPTIEVEEWAGERGTINVYSEGIND